MAFGNDVERKQVYQNYYDKNLNDFTNFYDSYHMRIPDHTDPPFRAS